MHKHRFSTVLALLLAAAVIFAGVGATRLAEEWLFPAPQPVYVPAGELPSTMLRLENNEYLQLYPMDEYDPETSAPAASLPLYTESFYTFCHLATSDRGDTEEQLRQKYHTTLNNILAEQLRAFFRPELPYFRPYELNLSFEPAAHMIDSLRYQPENGLFYLENFRVTMDIYRLHDDQVLPDVSGSITVAFRSDLLSEMELVYLRFDADSPQTQLHTTECYSWLLAHQRLYHGNKLDKHTAYSLANRPLDHLMQYLSGQYNAQRGKNAASWETLEKNFDCIIYRDEMLCVLSGGSQQVVFTFDPDVDCFVEFSLRAK